MKIPDDSSSLKFDYPFFLESGEVLHNVTIVYNTYGTINDDSSNVVWVCHALTANSDVADWWSGIIGKGKLFDPDKFFIICANILGSCYGSTGAFSNNPVTNKKYGKDFPLLTVRDLVQAHIALRKHLNISSIKVLIGGSLGGQQCLEWAITEPDIIKHLVPIATNAYHSPWGIAWNTAQRMALESDSHFYSDGEERVEEGLKTARAIAMLSYRSYHTYYETQKDDNNKFADFKSDSYQRYQGEKLVSRFDAHTYYTLTKVMDSHNVGRVRDSVESALRTIKAKTCIIGIQSDILFPIAEQQYLAKEIPNAEFHEIISFYGHDGFLLEFEQITTIITKFLNS